MPTAARVTATLSATQIATQSEQLAISTGIPDQNSMSLAFDRLAVDGTCDGERINVTLRMADRFNNPVPEGTAANFRTEGGAIQAQCFTGNPLLDPAEEAVEDVPDPRVAGPHVLGQVPEHRGPHRRLRVERVGLDDLVQARRARAGHPPGVGRQGAGEDLEQRRLAPAVAADDPDPCPGPDPEGDLVEDGSGAEGDARAFDGDEVGHPEVVAGRSDDVGVRPVRRGRWGRPARPRRGRSRGRRSSPCRRR